MEDRRVVAIGVDSAEPTLVRELIDRGELPALGALLERGEWALVDSRGDIGSGAVWPTFFTGTDPAIHQMYSGWSWKPDAMACGAPDESRMTPFWRSLARDGVTVGVLDVPWAPVGEIGAGAEIAEYGPHDVHYGEPYTSGAGAALLADAPRHPFYEVPYGPGFAEGVAGKQRLVAACMRGAELRADLAVRMLDEIEPDLAVIAFGEVHHCTHQLWHTVAGADDPVLRWVDTAPVEPDLREVYRHVDRHLGRIVEAAGPDAAVMVFSLHGMTSGGGIPGLQTGLLEAHGLAARSGWSGLSWRERRAAAFGALKRRSPKPVKDLYHRRLPYATRRRLAQRTIVPQHDWARTRAFAVPSDQRGFIRINLEGREAQGCVPARDYDAVCDEVVGVIAAAREHNGELVAAKVARTAEGGVEPPLHLPDVIVDWAVPAFADPLRVKAGSTEIVSRPRRLDMTGQHAPLGFCIAAPEMASGPIGEVVAGTELHRMLLAPLGAAAASP